MKVFFKVIIGSIFVLFLSIAGVVYSQGVGQSDVSIDALVEGCGDEIIETPEECDGGALGGASCLSEGFTSGSLSCTASCVFNTLACTYTPPSSGGGGGGGSSSQTKGATVVLSGRAYPKSEVTILKDAQVVATTISDATAHFQVSVEGLSAGMYLFSLYSEDIKGIRSSLFTFPVSVSKNVLAKVDNIFVAPTLTADKVEVKKGDPITLFGQSFPASSITIEVNSAQQIFANTLADANGVYLYNFDSSPLEIGQHYVKSRSQAQLALSSQSSAYPFEVGTRNISNATLPKCSTKADLNDDCKVNLVDFSIVAFWYQRPLNTSFIIRDKDHLNGDGTVNLVDFSILAFYWTG